MIEQHRVAILPFCHPNFISTSGKLWKWVPAQKTYSSQPIPKPTSIQASLVDCSSSTDEFPDLKAIFTVLDDDQGNIYNAQCEAKKNSEIDGSFGFKTNFLVSNKLG